jgi:hypothetical protein
MEKVFSGNIRGNVVRENNIRGNIIPLMMKRKRC